MNTIALNGNQAKKPAAVRSDPALEVTRKIPRSLFVLGNIILVILAILVVYSLLNIKCAEYTHIRSTMLMGTVNENIHMRTVDKLPAGIQPGNEVHITVINNITASKTTIHAQLLSMETVAGGTQFTLSADKAENATYLFPNAAPLECEMRITTGTQSVFNKIFGKFY